MNITQLLHIKYPILQGAMAHISTGEFAAAASNAGGLGIIAGGSMELQELEENIDRCRMLTANPFGVNIVLMHPQADEMARIAAEKKVPVITTGAGNPGKYVEMWKTYGCKVIPVVSTVALAKWLMRHNVDAIIAEGTESGGHVGEMTTMTLVPQVREAVTVPVIAAGGIASGAQLLAAFALGASGVQIGTRFLVSEECPVHINYKQAVLAAKGSDAIVTGRNIGAPVRCLKNSMTNSFNKMERNPDEQLEVKELTLGALRKAVLGDVRNGSLMAGQVAGQLNEIQPLQDIFTSLIEDYEKAYASLEPRL